MPVGYSGTPLLQKLGIKPGHRVCLLSAPEGFSRTLGALPPDAILYLLAQPLLDLASDHLMRDRDLTMRYEERFEVEGSDEWTAAMAEYNREADAITAALFRAQGEAGLAHLYLTDRRSFDRRMERGRQHFFGPPTGAHAAYLRSKGIID